MALKITHQEMDGADLLALDGRLVGGEETSALREKVKALLAEGKKNLVLDLSGVTMLDSTGLGALVTAHSSAKVGGATLRLCNLGSRSKHLLQMTKLYTIFEVSDTTE
jgi:anti-sigma B factor antagonist